MKPRSRSVWTSLATKVCCAVALPCLWFSMAAPALAAIKNLKTDYQAHGDGSWDDRFAFEEAFKKLVSGDTLYVPAGTYRLVLTSAVLGIPKGVTVLGKGDRSVLTLEKSGTTHPEGYWTLFKLAGNGVTVEGLTIRQAAVF